MASLDLTWLITRTIFVLLFSFIFYLIYKSFKSKKIGKKARFFAWLGGIFLIILGVLGLILTFFAFQSPDLTSQLAILLVFFIIFGLSFILLGIMMILTALGKLKKHS